MNTTPAFSNPAPLMLDISRRGTVLLPPADTFHLYLIGTGGTGSHLALALARLAWHAKRFNKTVNLTFVDPDTVEEKNVGRQLFCPAEIGSFKAETLAMRFNAAFGLDIHAIPTPLLPTTLNPRDLHAPHDGYRHQTLFIGAVDNHLARQAISRIATQQRAWWLDMGNENHSGRLYIGNVAETERLESLVQLNGFALCAGLPLPGLQDPALLEPPPPEAPALSCADLTAREEQSLMVNQMIAALAAQYVSDFVLARTLTTFRTTFTLNPPMVHSFTISENTLATLRADCTVSR
jgi:PRTRC genetic system ThiF family protein